MIGTLQQALKEMKKGVYDFTKDGKCSNCGNCCSNFLPMSDREVKRMKVYIKKHGIKPQKHGILLKEPVLDLTCPLRVNENKVCVAYKVRPAICKSFRCDKPKKDIQATKEEFHEKYRVVDLRKELWEE